MKSRLRSRLSEQCRRRREWVAQELLVGARLKALREARGLSQSELAELAGLSTYTIQNLEQDRASPRYDLVVAAYKPLGVGIELVPGGREAGVIACPWCLAVQDPQEWGAGREQPCQSCRRHFRVEPAVSLPVLAPCKVCGRRVAVKDGKCAEHYGYGEGAFRWCEGAGRKPGVTRRPSAAAACPGPPPSDPPPGPETPDPVPPDS